MSERVPMTPEGHRKLQAELKRLISEERSKNILEIEEARAHGDLKENAEYHAAKEKQGHIEARIQHINAVLANAEVIDNSESDSDKVMFGASVTYENIDTEETTTYQLVGHEEADVKQNKISIRSPIARALLGKEKGDEITIKVPKGTIEVEILAVKYP